jgi:hypothetical protein
MVASRRSSDTQRNESVRELAPVAGERNTQWLTRAGVTHGILLVGGSSVAHFRVRVAQSHFRTDLCPSFWSLVGILGSDGGQFVSVPLELRGPAAEVPLRNAVQACRLADYDDPEEFPNIAVLRFAEHADVVQRNIERVETQRAIIDLPSLMLPWLAYIWGAGQPMNPLLSGHGLPSAAFVEAVYNLSDVELTPGLSSAASSPEAIWQAAVWWRTFYTQAVANTATADVAPIVPTGVYAVRQPEAAAHNPGGGGRSTAPPTA